MPCPPGHATSQEGNDHWDGKNIFRFKFEADQPNFITNTFFYFDNLNPQ